ncbi:SDR family NAD(P)-dependent oxidoreductase [Herpetosiphon geysericola]|uniref:Probable oxidoreductase n=1 Tax=Herpetosiphon geysericola TaxID=70996 RepID=A0A0P6YFM0_9CHLR|nr:SDR family NAD(P)-dependent oxidoreductase [Herpetosiphon geysericola]KPL90969.1 oxidoreductase [Herpetosiphon geysericola]
MSLITTPFGFASTAAEVAAGIDCRSQRMIVTGAASGIGVETARALASTGAEVTLAVRDLAAGEKVAAELRASTGNAAILVSQLDLADRASIARFVAQWQGPLHVLVNNAGVMASPEQYTNEGWESQFAVNHLGHFALSLGLQPALVAAGGARVVVVSSSAHMRSPVIFDDVHFAFRPYDPWLAYGQAKTANVLFAVEADARWAAQGIRVNALMPGAILTNLQRHVGGTMRVAPEIQKTVAQGAATSVLLGISPLLTEVGGRYFADCNEQPIVSRRPVENPLLGVAGYALDRHNAQRLWNVSLELLGL